MGREIFTSVLSTVENGLKENGTDQKKLEEKQNSLQEGFR